MLSWFKRTPARPLLPHILVSEEAMAADAPAYAAMMDVVDFTNKVLHGALFKTEELPIEAYTLYMADFYVAQVNNGGHSQYLHNERNGNSATRTLQDSLSGLQSIGFTPYARTLADLIDWVRKNPQEAEAQNGFTNRAEYLEALDKRFFDVGSDGFYLAARDWLRQSPKVRILPAARIQQELAALQDRNPAYPARRRINTIAALDADLASSLVSPFRACVAGATTKDALFEVRHILRGHPSRHPANGTPGFDFARAESQVWTLECNISDPLYGFLHEGTVHIAVEEPETKELHSLFQRPETEVEALLQAARKHPPARYALRLLEEAAPGEEVKFLTFAERVQAADEKAQGTMVYGVITTSGRQFSLLVQDKGAGHVSHPGGDMLSVIKGKEFASLRGEDHSRLP